MSSERPFSAQPIAQPAAREHRDRADGREDRAQAGRVAHAVAQVVVQVQRRPDIEGLADYRAAEGQQANEQEGAAAQQRQQQRRDARGRRLASRRTDSADWAWPRRDPPRRATRAETGNSPASISPGDDGREQEQRAPAEAALDEHAHLLAGQRRRRPGS